MRTFFAFATPALLTAILVSLLIPGLVPSPLGWPRQLTFLTSMFGGDHAAQRAAAIAKDVPQAQLAPAHLMPQVQPAEVARLAPIDGTGEETGADTVDYPADGIAEYVPVTITTTVRLSGTPDVEPADTLPVVGNDPWPALCGEVVDASGAPIAGASVALAATETTETTDAKGNFCMPCPRRHVTLHVSAEGLGAVDYPIQLDGRFTQVRLILPQGH
jgi:hypothetical protein